MLIAEFEKQNFTQVIFPHKATDWSCCLQEARQTFITIINAIRKFQPCVVVCDDVTKVQNRFRDTTNLVFISYTSNDTWARDISALCVETPDGVQLLNFIFNGWGGKFEAGKDNAMNTHLQHLYKNEMITCNFVLEGGGIESNGEGLLLTTAHCMLNPNRHPNATHKEISDTLKKCFGAKEILYLHHGYLAGDDTDSHIDTLARFVAKDAIMYVTCKDETDEHYEELLKMEQELQHFAQKYSLKLIPLPLPSPIYHENERLPATYANFLFLNNAVLVPVYGVQEDAEALEIFQASFPEREIVAIPSQTLIKQHGSLHCVTMNFAKGVVLNTTP